MRTIAVLAFFVFIITVGLVVAAVWLAHILLAPRPYSDPEPPVQAHDVVLLATACLRTHYRGLSGDPTKKALIRRPLSPPG